MEVVCTQFEQSLQWVRSFSFPGSTPVCVGFFSRTNVGNYLHTFVLEKENATHRDRPREAKRTHPMEMYRVYRLSSPSAPKSLLTLKENT